MNNERMVPLGRKIVAAVLGTSLVALLLTLVLNLVPMVMGYRQNEADRSRAMAELMVASLAAPVDFADADAANESLATLALIPGVTGAAVYAGGVKPFAQFGSPPAWMEAPELTIISQLSTMTVACPIPTEVQGGVLVLSVSMDKQWLLLKKGVLSGGIIALLVFIFCFKAAGFFRRKLGDPIGDLTETIRNISQKKDYSRRVDHVSNDEIGLLVTEFNRMLERVEFRDEQLNRHKAVLEERVHERTLLLQKKRLELLHNNRLLLSEIKKRAKAEMIREEVERINRHDLKSGLSLVIGYPELILAEGGLSPRQEKHIKRVRAAGYRMLDLIRNQLDIFKMEKGIYQLSTSCVDLVEVLCELEEEFAPQLESTGVSLSLRLEDAELVGDETFSVTGEVPLMRTMLRNLVQNGIEASSNGGEVIVTLSKQGAKTVTIANASPVPKEMRRRFFDKYATHGKENGTGLGTYFAALIASTHGADISMKTGEEVGTLITITLDKRVVESSESLNC